MSGRGLEWYKREPVRYLGGVQGLSAKEHAVYSIVLDLIYVHGGSCNHDPRWIAGWISDMGQAAVRKAIEALVERGKLRVEGDQLTQDFARKLTETQEKLRSNRASAGQLGGERSGKSRREKSENNHLAEASGSTREEKKREEERRVLPFSSNEERDQWQRPTTKGKVGGWHETAAELRAAIPRDGTSILSAPFAPGSSSKR